MATAIAGKREATTASEALRHPIRVRILEALTELDMSPKQFFHSGRSHGMPGLKGKDQDAVLTHIAYHFRVLAKSGCIEIIETRPVRGAVEHIYRAKARAEFDEEQWAALDPEERVEVSKVVLQSLIAQAEGAMLSDTFDSRTDRCLAWIPLKLDEPGWTKMIAALEACYSEVGKIQEEATSRLEETGAEPIPATFGIFGFESPQRPVA